MKTKITYWFWIIFLLLIPLHLNASKLMGNVKQIACAALKPNIILAVVDNNIWTSFDAGLNWGLQEILPATALSDDNVFKTKFLNTTHSITLNVDEPTKEETLESFELLKNSTSNDFNAFEYSPIIAAISNNGEYAVWFNDVIFMGGGLISGKQMGEKRESEIQSIAKYKLKKTNVKGLVFDLSGRLWISTNNKLECYNNNHLLKSWPIIGAAFMSLSNDTGVLLVPGTKGIWQVNTKHRSLNPKLLNISIGVSSVNVATFDQAGNLYLFGLGILKIKNKQGMLINLGSIPFVPKRIIVDNLNVIRAMNNTGQWFELKQASWKKLEFTALACNAIGQLWIGNGAGVSKFIKQYPNHVVDYLSPQMKLSFESLYFQVLENMGSAPCQASFNPLPIVNLTGKFGRNDGKKTYFSTTQTQSYAKSWIYVGLTFTWNIKNTSQINCLDSLNKYLAIIENRKIQLRQLWLARFIALASLKNATYKTQKILPLVPQIVPSVIASQIELKKIDEMIRIVSGLKPKDEKQ